MIREVFQECSLDYRLEVAQDGQDALSYLRSLESDPTRTYPALILLDLNLPKVTGLEVLQQIRNDPRCCRIPVIIVTSSIAESDRTAATRLGADGYFHKPVDLDAYRELAELVRKVIG